MNKSGRSTTKRVSALRAKEKIKETMNELISWEEELASNNQSVCHLSKFEDLNGPETTKLQCAQGNNDTFEVDEMNCSDEKTLSEEASLSPNSLDWVSLLCEEVGSPASITNSVRKRAPKRRRRSLHCDGLMRMPIRIYKRIEPSLCYSPLAPQYLDFSPDRSPSKVVIKFHRRM